MGPKIKKVEQMTLRVTTMSVGLRGGLFMISLSLSSCDMATAGNKSQKMSISKVRMADRDRGRRPAIQMKKGTNSDTYNKRKNN